MKKAIIIFMIMGILMIMAYGAINILSDKTILADQKIITRFDDLGFSNISYIMDCDYRECTTKVYADKDGRIKKAYLGKFTFEADDLTDLEKDQKMRETFNDYFLYRIERSSRSSGSITLERSR